MAPCAPGEVERAHPIRLARTGSAQPPGVSSEIKPGWHKVDGGWRTFAQLAVRGTGPIMERTIQSGTGRQWKVIGIGEGIAWTNRQLRKPSRPPPGRCEELAVDSIGFHSEESTDEVFLIKGVHATVTTR